MSSTNCKSGECVVLHNTPTDTLRQNFCVFTVRQYSTQKIPKFSDSTLKKCTLLRTLHNLKHFTTPVCQPTAVLSYTHGYTHQICAILQHCYKFHFWSVLQNTLYVGNQNLVYHLQTRNVMFWQKQHRPYVLSWWF